MSICYKNDLTAKDRLLIFDVFHKMKCNPDCWYRECHLTNFIGYVVLTKSAIEGSFTINMRITDDNHLTYKELVCPLREFGVFPEPLLVDQGITGYNVISDNTHPTLVHYSRKGFDELDAYHAFTMDETAAITSIVNKTDNRDRPMKFPLGGGRDLMVLHDAGEVKLSVVSDDEEWKIGYPFRFKGNTPVTSEPLKENLEIFESLMVPVAKKAKRAK